MECDSSGLWAWNMHLPPAPIWHKSRRTLRQPGLCKTDICFVGYGWADRSDGNHCAWKARDRWKGDPLRDGYDGGGYTLCVQSRPSRECLWPHRQHPACMVLYRFCGAILYCTIMYSVLYCTVRTCGVV